MLFSVLSSPLCVCVVLHLPLEDRSEHTTGVHCFFHNKQLRSCSFFVQKFYFAEGWKKNFCGPCSIFSHFPLVSRENVLDILLTAAIKSVLPGWKEQGVHRGYYRSRDKSLQVPIYCLQTSQCHQLVIGKEWKEKASKTKKGWKKRGSFVF